MIEKIEIRNFRKHSKLDLEFGPGVTSIVGSSYAGKSCVIRALRLAMLNQPSGMQYIKWGKEKTIIRLFADDSKITRIRSKSINKYKLDKKPFAAFGSDVPPEIGKLLNISSINFQNQHDAPFWFSETAGQVSRQLNSIINLDVIDTTLSNIASELTAAKQEKTSTELRLKNAIEKEKELQYADDMNKDLCLIEHIVTAKEENASKSLRIDDLWSRGVRLLKTKENAVQTKQAGDIALEAYKTRQEISISIKTLRNSIESAEIYQTELLRRPESFNEIKELKAQYIAIDNEYDAMKDIIDDIEYQQEEICQIESDLKLCKKQLDKATEGKCPLCRKPMTK